MIVLRHNNWRVLLTGPSCWAESTSLKAGWENHPDMQESCSLLSPKVTGGPEKVWKVSSPSAGAV